MVEFLQLSCCGSGASLTVTGHSCSSCAFSLGVHVLSFMFGHEWPAGCLATPAWLSDQLTFCCGPVATFAALCFSLLLLRCSSRRAAAAQAAILHLHSGAAQWHALAVLFLFIQGSSSPFSSHASSFIAAHCPAALLCAGQQLCRPLRLFSMRPRGTSRGRRCLESSLRIRTKQVGRPMSGPC